MKLRSVISSLLLAVYATSVLGYALTIILCHCSRSEHFRTHHCSGEHTVACCHHHAPLAGDGIRTNHACDCHHDHTTEIDLYDTTRIANTLAEPLVCYALPAMIADQTISPVGVRVATLTKRKIPLPEEPTSTSAALRAPPVIA